jgi:hypothetical protein
MLFVSEPPCVLINLTWWRGASRSERRSWIDALRLDVESRSPSVFVWGQYPARAAGTLERLLSEVPDAFWEDLLSHDP